MTTGAIIQVRMSSTRMPGKVLRPLNGKPLLLYLIEKLDRCQALDGFLVCTSTDPSDDPVKAFCLKNDIPLFRGPLGDVAGRFHAALQKSKFNPFVRINGDSPLLDTRLIDKGVTIYRNGSFDLVTNVLYRSYPKGQSVEVVNAKTFHLAYSDMDTPEEKEHVTRHFYLLRDRYRIFNFYSGKTAEKVGLAVDTERDFKVIERIINKMSKPHWKYRWEEILSLKGEV